jgi:type II secretory pathway component PulC
MINNVNVIWKKGDGEMPEKARHTVEAAQNELLLKTLQLPAEVIDTIRYNADKNAQTVNDYISSIIIERMQTAS